MKYSQTNKERGVVMILILVFLTMFAMMVSAFLFMTSSMSDSAASSLALSEKGEAAADRIHADIDSAIRTLLIGTNNEASPIGPFGILENLYGDPTTMAGYDFLAVRSFNLYAEYQNVGSSVSLQPVKAIVDVNLDDQALIYAQNLYQYCRKRLENLDNVGINHYDAKNRKRLSDSLQGVLGDLPDLSPENIGKLTPEQILTIVNRFRPDVCSHILESGSAISFGSLQWNENVPDDAQGFLAACRLFNEYVSGTSAPVIKKELDDTGSYLHIEVALTEELEKFFSYVARGSDDFAWPCSPYSAAAFALQANARLNPPAFSGTGAGSFEPNTVLDGQLDTETDKNKIISGGTSEETAPSNPGRIPYAFWANAAAPDITPYCDLDGNTSFQTYWRHLADSEFRAYTADAEGILYPFYNGYWWFPADLNTAPDSPVRMNPGYTAVDQRNLFLSEVSTDGHDTTVTPSFIRPETLTALRSLLDAAAEESQLRRSPALLRKATPRPLRADHWNWTGGNEELIASPYGSMTDDPETIKAAALAELDALIGKKWDVDNDNDGEKDGIWIPSGLPIRADENGTPYATMYSFTVLDMDGRVNVNTAGNWNQLPYPGGDYYSKLTNDENNGLVDLAELFSAAAADPNSPWYPFENLKAGIGWYNDADDEITTKSISRGTGLGPAGVDLAEALRKMGFNPERTPAGRDKYGENAANILAARYFSSAYGNLSGAKVLPDMDGYPFFDGLESGFSNIAQIALRGQLRQPSAYYAEPGSAARTDPSKWISDDSDEHRRFYLHTDAVYRGDKNGDLADPELFLFPWRGKTRIFDYVSHYPKKYSSYPTFDFCDTALRSYDPLGNDLLTYMPKYSENPYLVNPYGSTSKDATFTAEMLELLLRPFDYDRKSRNTVLLRALLADKVSDALNNPQKDEYNRLRSDITTISSDIPVPASALSVGITEVPDGVFGLRQLIRRCVLLEIYKANRESKFGNSYAAGKKTEFAAEFGISTETEEGKSQFRAYLRRQIEKDVSAWKSGALDKITDQLFALLPQDIQEGRRLDLNALSRKACWIDSAYEEQDDGTFVRTLPTGSVDTATREEFDYYHQLGLVERMKFARGLYLLLMTLTYEDRNAETVREFYDNDPDARLTDDDVYKDYLEGCDKPYIDKLTAVEDAEETLDEKKARLAAELTANRIAQYCVNLVDFSDPDATMTPFFYDPDPFDGWWSYRKKDADWIYGDHQGTGEGETPPEHQGSDTLGFVLYTPETDIDDLTRDFYDALIPRVDEDGNQSRSFFSTPDANITEETSHYINDGLDVEFADSSDTYSQSLVAWLNGQSLNNTGIGQDDFGFRLIWGMERPDLLLTETLNFHDLGIADTSADASGKTVYSGEDEDFDQVRRPLGSTYLELYCAANPNVPQSPELYQFDKDRNLWKLELSKMTPRQKADSPYEGKQFPVWRVAITASTDPRKNEEQEKEFTDTVKAGESDVSVTYKRTIRKEKNSVAERLLGENADQRTFSLHTRQFCDLAIDSSGEKSLDEKLNSRWRGYDYTVANILGPCAEPQKDGLANYTDEIELDRIVWFGWPTASGGSAFDTISEFPDAAHIFGRVKETTGDKLTTSIFPNQYLVVAPAEKRAIGSEYKNENYFGIPSSRKVVMTNLREANSGKWTNSDYILAGTYNGLDINSDDKFEVNKRGINISEPLWTGSTDPYPNTIPTKDITYEGETVTVTDNDRRNTVPDQLFELPATDRKNDRFPIAADHLLGLGTIPGIRSAFVQRVADPNRPYHPFANPYISVDWNMMDLTVFNGEANGSGDSQTDDRFYTADDNEVDATNKILAPKSVFLSDAKKIEFETDTANTTSIFSSRAWLDPEQKGFMPDSLTEDRRPNVWARTLSKAELQKEDKAGLRKVVSISSTYHDLTDIYAPFDSSDTRENVVHIFPYHTLGAYNNAENRVTELDGQFSGAANAEDLRKLYYGAPAREGSDESFQPFEYLVWNDASFSSPAEILLVPASTPGRFGLEYIRTRFHKDKENGGATDGIHFAFMFQDGAEDPLYGKLGRSLGSDGGVGGFNMFGGNESGTNILGSYLNFFNTSNVKGNSLNLSILLDFVTVPSLYMGTQVFCGYDSNGDPVYVPTLREPGKINLNTVKESGWQGILGNNPRHPFTRFAESRSETPFKPAAFAPLELNLSDDSDSESGESGEDDESGKIPAPGNLTLLRGDLNAIVPSSEKKGNNLYASTEELRKLSGLTTNRSNVFAVWLTVGYFAVERARPGVNMPAFDPDGNNLLTYADPVSGQALVDANGNLNLPPTYKYCNYYKAIYPDGYTYGKELGSGGVDTEGVNRPRAFYLIDRSIPVDFRRGRSWNWTDTILLQRRL